MRFLPFNAGVFAAVVSLGSSYGYLPSEETDLRSSMDVKRTLVKGGIFLLDVFNRERMAQRYRQRFSFGLWRVLLGYLSRFPQFAGLFRWREYPSFYLLQKRVVTDGGSRLRDLWVFREKQTGKISIVYHVSRLYDLSQLQVMLKAAGFRILCFYGTYEGQAYSGDSSRLIAVSQNL
jgi:SAM-dependent methyltransferase